MSKRIPLVVAGVIFSLVALLHLLRIFFHWKIIIAEYNVSMLASVVAFIIITFIALWMFIAAAKK
ncbi:hypothetical protein [Legionella cincinnatiensis]|uniref:Uncharacterized protein n=1 Tax=Legionella cincinnatiensis TaxID=28085 RepID=A0A378IIX7_9GAMM|nr:hypothetical protein [Legionella cincinnatiensis]KTC83589.1 hypothetical protein Lcin_2276 [Legionella cincinnatiensis]STX34451.1 Uncharacterised protein [Legionella cincinnatiensis]